MHCKDAAYCWGVDLLGARNRVLCGSPKGHFRHVIVGYAETGQQSGL